MVKRRKTHGLSAGVGKHLGVNVDGFALDLVGPTGVVADASNNGTNISLGHGDGLSVVERLDSSESVKVLLDKIGKLVEESGTGGRGSCAPLALKGLAGSSYGNIDILLGGFADGGDDLLGGGVDNFELLLVNTLNPLVVDEAGALC